MCQKHIIIIFLLKQFFPQNKIIEFDSQKESWGLLIQHTDFRDDEGIFREFAKVVSGLRKIAGWCLSGK